MKRFILLIISIIAGLKVNSQDKLFVSIDASPNYSYRTYKLMDYSAGNSDLPSGKFLYDNFKHYYDSIESPKFGYQITFRIGYYLTDKFSFVTGILYKNIGYKINMSLPIGHFTYNGYITSIYSDNHKLDLYSNLYYVGIPVEIQYNVYSIGKFNIGFNIGSSFDFLVNHDSKYLTNSDIKPREDYSDYSKIAIDLIAGIRIGYKINNKFEAFAMPHFSDYITPNVKINAILSNDLFVKINQYNYYGDIKIGVIYKL